MNKIETNVVKPDTKIISNDIEYRIIDLQVETSLDAKLKEAEDFMTFNTKSGLSDQEQDELYGKAKIMWREYYDIHATTKYMFYLNRRQYKFLTDLITQKLEYDVETVFLAVGLTELLASMEKKKYTNDNELNCFEVTAVEITYIYHLISKYKAKGLNNDTYRFSEVLLKIGEISKVFNYYENMNKQLSTTIQNWVMTLQEGVTTDVDTQGSVVKPTKKKQKADQDAQ